MTGSEGGDRARSEDFRLGAPVHCADGRHIGDLQRVIVDRESWDPHAVIVRETKHFSGHRFAPGAGMMIDELIVPMKDVASVTRDQVTLGITAAEARHLPPYLSYEYAPLQKGDALRYAVSLAAGPLSAPTFPRLKETADKPEGDIEIRPGENVMIGHDGDRLGTVRDVLFDEGELAGIVVHPEGFFTHDVVVQVRFLDRSDDMALFVTMRPEDVQNLAAFAPDRGGVS